MARFHLAQVNIGRLRAPIGDPIMEGFRSQLDPINALAELVDGAPWLPRISLRQHHCLCGRHGLGSSIPLIE
jgi:hypothetical protein